MSTRSIHVRFPTDILELVHHQAARAGEPAAQYIRTAALGRAVIDLARRGEPLPAAVHELTEAAHRVLGAAAEASR